MLLSFSRTLILYLTLIAGMRLLGKRQIGQLEPSEFVVAMLIADLASVPMQNSGIPLLYGLVPILTVLHPGIPGFPLPDNPAGCIGRTVINHDQFPPLMGLGHHRRNGKINGFFRIPGRHND